MLNADRSRQEGQTPHRLPTSPGPLSIARAVHGLNWWSFRPIVATTGTLVAVVE